MSKKQESIFSYLKKYKMILPIGCCLLLQMMACCIEEMTDSVLRSVPRILLNWATFFSVILLIFWISHSFYGREDRKELKVFQILKIIWYVVLGIIGAGVIVIGAFFSAFKYRPEHVVESNGIQMVACVNSFLQEQVHYYEYKNVLFRGRKEIGYEDYGNGGRDPLNDSEREPIHQYWDE